MQTVIHSNDFAITRALDSFIKDHADKSMRVCADQVERLVVRLKDVNGPKGGQDKECCVEITIANHAPIVVSKRSSDAYASIRQALRRASRITLRKLGKRRASMPAKPSAQPETTETWVSEPSNSLNTDIEQ
ncbi:MAG: ribosome-associated translation inhibitor RaiA [Arenicella sp.]|jgi:ribosome-associated translation inhibitor RaiA